MRKNDATTAQQLLEEARADDGAAQTPIVAAQPPQFSSPHPSVQPLLDAIPARSGTHQSTLQAQMPMHIPVDRGDVAPLMQQTCPTQLDAAHFASTSTPMHLPRMRATVDQFTSLHTANIILHAQQQRQHSMTQVVQLREELDALRLQHMSVRMPQLSMPSAHATNMGVSSIQYSTDATAAASNPSALVSQHMHDPQWRAGVRRTLRKPSDFSNIDGMLTMQRWLRQFDFYCDINEIPPGHRGFALHAYVDGDAKEFYYSINPYTLYNNWEDTKHRLVQRFDYRSSADQVMADVDAIFYHTAGTLSELDHTICLKVDTLARYAQFSQEWKEKRKKYTLLRALPVHSQLWTEVYKEVRSDATWNDRSYESVLQTICDKEEVLLVAGIRPLDAVEDVNNARSPQAAIRPMHHQAQCDQGVIIPSRSSGAQLSRLSNYAQAPQHAPSASHSASPKLTRSAARRQRAARLHFYRKNRIAANMESTAEITEKGQEEDDSEAGAALAHTPP